MKLFFTSFLILIISLHSFAQPSFKVFSVNQSLTGGNIVADGHGQYDYAAQALSKEQTGSLLVGKLNAGLSFNWYHLFTDSAHNFQSGTRQPVIACRDGGLAITAFDGTYDNVLTVLKTNAAGKLLWSKRYNTNIFTYASNLTEAPDGSLLVVNNVAPPTSQGPASILRINGKNGNLIWAKTLTIGNTCSAACIVITKDSGFVVGGSGEARDGVFDFVAKYNAKGIVEWKRIFRSPVQGGNAYSQIIEGITQTLDGGYIYTGEAPSTNTNNIYDLSVVKLNATGDIEWAKTIGSDGPGEDYGTTIYQNVDSSYTIGGVYNSNSAILVKLSKTGESLLQSVINPGYIYGSIGIPDGNGGFLFAGSYSNSTFRKQSCYVARLDSTGFTCTSSFVQQPLLDMAISRIALLSTSADVTKLITTDTAYFTTTPLPMFSNIICSEQNIADGAGSLIASANKTAMSATVQASVYPNPVSSSLQIRLSGKTAAWQIQVMDVTGKTLFSRQYADAGNCTKVIDVSGWAKGLYIVKASHDGVDQIIKVMKSN